MVVEIVLSDDEKRILKDYKRSGYATIQRKAEAILLCAGGVDIVIVADFVDRSEITLNRWLAAFRRIRLASIYTEHLGNTNASKLTEEQRQRLHQVLSQATIETGDTSNFLVSTSGETMGSIREAARAVQAVGEEFEALSDGELYHGIDFGDSLLARAVESYGKDIEDRTYRLHNWCVRSSRALEDFAADVESTEEEIEYDFTYEALGVS